MHTYYILKNRNFTLWQSVFKSNGTRNRRRDAPLRPERVSWAITVSIDRIRMVTRSYSITNLEGKNETVKNKNPRINHRGRTSILLTTYRLCGVCQCRVWIVLPTHDTSMDTIRKQLSRARYWHWSSTVCASLRAYPSPPTPPYTHLLAHWSDGTHKLKLHNKQIKHATDKRNTC